MDIHINTYKNRIVDFITTAKERTWIDDDSYNSLISQFNNETVTIGVVGQMKSGKSTLINALVFGDSILPTSEIPMTAALTYISYGEEFSADIETITEKDYQEIAKIATKGTDDKEKLSACQILNNISSIDSFADLFAKHFPITREDDLEEYVGATGKFTPIVKCAHITYPHDSLKGMCIVDTPGYNDPISSRSLLTMRFLSRANVILHIQDVAQVFSISDVDLLTQQIPRSGIGKLISVINKIDSESEEGLNNVREYANSQKDKISNQYEDIRELLNNCPIVPVSSIMALLSQVDNSKIDSDGTLAFFYSQLLNDRPYMSDKSILFEKSGFIELQRQISDVILSQKKQLLFEAPCNKLLSFLRIKLNKLVIEKESLEQINENLSDRQLDIASVQNDLQLFETKVSEYLSTLILECNSDTGRQIENAAYTMRDIRNRCLNKVDFVQNENKKYLRSCFNRMEVLFDELNTSFGDVLRNLGSSLSEIVHGKINYLENEMNQIVLNNSQLIHINVIRRINNEINNSIPRIIGDDIHFKVEFPNYWDRMDVYDCGIRHYFRQIIQDNFSNEYINEKVSIYEDIVNKLISCIDENITDVIDETRRQFDLLEDAEIASKIIENESRISEISISMQEICSFITAIQQFSTEI